MAEGSRIHARLGDTRGAAEGAAFEALFELDAGDLETARELAATAVRELRDIGYRRGLVGAMVVLSRVETAMGNHQAGAVLLGAAEAIFGRDPTELPVIGDGDVVTTLKRELGAVFQATVDEGRAIGWDGLHQWLDREPMQSS